MAYAPVKKAVIPAAGFGTRMLPFTKAVPKELIPLVDKPVIQYVVEEAAASGISEILLIISRGKEAILRHFENAPLLAEFLQQKGDAANLLRLQTCDRNVNICHTYQQKLAGLGDAVLCAADFVGNEPFALLLGDTVMESTNGMPVTGQLKQIYERFGSSVAAVTAVPREKLSRYGVIGGRSVAPGVVEVETIVEKPAPEKAPGNLAVAARYLFTPGIFDRLRQTLPGLGGEIQLTDAMAGLLKQEKLYGCEICGRRYDLGSKAGFIAANLHFALQNAETAAEVKKILEKM